MIAGRYHARTTIGQNAMNCEQLASRISLLEPDMAPLEVARLCLLLLNQVNHAADLADDEELQRQWKIAAFRLEAATDQHAAMSSELDLLCDDGPVRFDPEQIWTLLRAVKIHSHLLELYTGQRAIV